MLSERTIINGLILIAGMILGPYLIIMTFEVNQIALLSFSGIVFLFAIFFLVKDRISVFPFLGAYFVGTLNFLPLGLTPIEIFCAATILYYLVNYVVLKRKSFDPGPLYILTPLLVIGGIVLLHNHSLKVLGGGEEGSRPALLILLSIATYLCGINIPIPSTAFLRWVPVWCLLLTCLGSAPFLLTTYFPNLAPYVYYVSGNVNMNAYLESINGSDFDDVERNGALIGIGGALQAVLISYYAINTWWRPTRWIFVVLSLLAFVATLSGGYRNALLSFALTTFVGAICYCRWRVLLILPLLALVPLGIIFVQNEHPNGMVLPNNIQRTMSFLPGSWDPGVVSSADSSNDFRAEIKQVYIAEYLHKSPWIGNGFTFDPNESDGYDKMSKTPGVSDPFYYTIKTFLTAKNFHVGWISLYDAVGIIGGVAFVFLYLAMIWRGGCLIFASKVDVDSPLFPLKIWLFANVLVGAIGYFTTFGNFGSAVVALCGIAILMVFLDRLEKENSSRRIIPAPQIPLSMPKRAEIFSL